VKVRDLHSRAEASLNGSEASKPQVVKDGQSTRKGNGRRCVAFCIVKAMRNNRIRHIVRRLVKLLHRSLNIEIDVYN
jgi:hypothetical protein